MEEEIGGTGGNNKCI